MAAPCTHIEHIRGTPPVAGGCVECLQMGGTWVHLRRCDECGHVGCCNNSPNKHATAHFNETRHPLVQSFEPGEEWYWCYQDDLGFELEGADPSPSHP